MADTHLAHRLTWQGAFEERTPGSSIGFVRCTIAPVGRTACRGSTPSSALTESVWAASASLASCARQAWPV